MVYGHYKSTLEQNATTEYLRIFHPIAETLIKILPNLSVYCKDKEVMNKIITFWINVSQSINKILGIISTFSGMLSVLTCVYFCCVRRCVPYLRAELGVTILVNFCVIILGSCIT